MHKELTDAEAGHADPLAEVQHMTKKKTTQLIYIDLLGE